MQGATAGKAIRRSIQGMLEELENNLYEHILTRLVDYGHTFSMELEMAALVSGNELLHGEAVNIDMALTTQVHPMFPCQISDSNYRAQLRPFFMIFVCMYELWNTILI